MRKHAIRSEKPVSPATKSVISMKTVLFVIIIIVPLLLLSGVNSLINNTVKEEVSRGYFCSDVISYTDENNDAIYPSIIDTDLIGVFSEKSNDYTADSIKNDVFILSAFDSVTGEYIDGFFIIKGFTHVNEKEIENLMGSLFVLERVGGKK